MKVVNGAMGSGVVVGDASKGEVWGRECGLGS